MIRLNTKVVFGVAGYFQTFHLKGKLFRLSNMGKRSEADMVGLLYVVERTLADLGFAKAEPGAAVEAAERYLASQD